METYFNTGELGEYLHIAGQTIRRWVAAGEIPYHRIHNVIRFRLSEIEKWVDNGGMYAPPEGGENPGDGSPGETETGETEGGAV